MEIFKSLVLQLAPIIEKLSGTLKSQRLLKDEVVDLELLDKGLESHSQPSANFKLLKRISRSYSLTREVKDIPAPYVLGGMWKKIVEKNYSSLDEAVATNNLDSLNQLLSNFFRNDAGDGLVFNKYSKVAGYDLYKKKKYTADLLRRKNLVLDYHDYSEKLYAPTLGNMFGLRDEQGIFCNSSLRHYHYSQKVHELVKDIPEPVVAEIGGGYGGFAYYLLRDRPDITYINFDIPQTLLTCSFYLMSLFPERTMNLFDESTNMDEITIRKGELILYPNFMLPFLPSDSVDLFINTGSLSEMDRGTVSEYLERIQNSVRKYFLTENSNASGVNRNHEEVPLQDFAIDKRTMKEIYRFPSMLGDIRYVESLFEKIYRINDEKRAAFL